MSALLWLSHMQWQRYETTAATVASWVVVTAAAECGACARLSVSSAQSYLRILISRISRFRVAFSFF